MAEKVKRCPFCGSKVTVKVPFTRDIIENPNFVFVCLNSVIYALAQKQSYN